MSTTTTLNAPSWLSATVSVRPRDQIDPHGFRVARQDGAIVGPVLAPLFLGRALTGVGLDPILISAGQRQLCDAAHGSHSRQRRDALSQAFEETDPRFRIPVLEHRQGNRHREDVHGMEPWLHL